MASVLRTLQDAYLADDDSAAANARLVFDIVSSQRLLALVEESGAPSPAVKAWTKRVVSLCVGSSPGARWDWVVSNEIALVWEHRLLAENVPAHEEFCSHHPPKVGWCSSDGSYDSAVRPDCFWRSVLKMDECSDTAAR